MKRFLCLLIAGLALSGLAGAVQLCTGPTSVTGLTCSVGGLTFSNFQIIAAAGNAAPEIDLVSATVASGSVTLTFNPNMSAAPGGGAQDMYLYYQISGAVNQVALSVSGANGTIMETACSAPIATTGATPNICPGGSHLANMLVFSQEGINSASVVFQTPPQNVYIFKDIGVSPSAPSTSGGTIASFTQSYTVNSGGGSGSGSEVPEPMTLMLLGSGLLAVGLMRHRTRTE